MDFNTSSHPDTAPKKLRQSSLAQSVEPSRARGSDGRTGDSRGHNVENSQQQNRVSVRRPRGRRVLRRVALGVAIVAGLVAAWFACRYFVYQGVDRSRYQAVYLDNDNVYFGKVQYLVNGTILLKDVFRVQAEKDSTGQSAAASTSATSSTAGTSQTSPSIRLIKPGKELHAPDDTMLINRGKVLFIENLKTDGNVTKAIIDFHKENAAAK